MPQPVIITETVSCALCGGREHETLFVGRDRLHHTPGAWPVVRCRGCGLVFTNPRPAPESVGLVYPESYRPHQRPRRKRQSRRWKLQQWALRYHWNYPPRRGGWLGKILSGPVMLWVRGKARNYDLFPYQGEGRLLDYGCGNGKFLLAMRDRGWQVQGMDLTPQAVERCRAEGLEARLGRDMDEYPPNSFDAITLWQVIEHVPSPRQTLGQAWRALRPGGLLTMSLPNFDSLTARWFGPYWFPLELPRHVTHFTPVTLKRILAEENFTDIRFRPQRYGQWAQSSFKFVGEEHPSRLIQWLLKRKGCWRLMEIPGNLLRKPTLMVVHARKPGSA